MMYDKIYKETLIEKMVDILANISMALQEAASNNLPSVPSFHPHILEVNKLCKQIHCWL